MILEIIVRKRNQEGILGNYQIHYLTGFDLYICVWVCVYCILGYTPGQNKIITSKNEAELSQ